MATLCSELVFRDACRTLVTSVTLVVLSFSVLASEDNLSPDQVSRGAYLVRAGGCISCHTNTKNSGDELAGGVALKTNFGTFYAPNITPDPKFGLGNWSKNDFITAMTKGVSPRGLHYYPAFPYTSYSSITRTDLSDLWAYLKTVVPSKTRNREHDLPFPLSIRLSAMAWKLLFFRPLTDTTDINKTSEWNRGAYLVTALGHCAECHTPRTLFGAPKKQYSFSGTRQGPDSEVIPNITPDPKTGIGNWNSTDIIWYLKTGFLPDGDVAGSSMADVIDHSTSHLTDNDLLAVATYLQSLQPVYRPKKSQP